MANREGVGRSQLEKCCLVTRYICIRVAGDIEAERVVREWRLMVQSKVFALKKCVW